MVLSPKSTARLRSSVVWGPVRYVPKRCEHGMRKAGRALRRTRPDRVISTSTCATATMLHRRDRDDVAFAVCEPRGLAGRTQIGDPADGLHPRQVVLLEHDATVTKLAHHRLDLLDLEACDGMLGLRALALIDKDRAAGSRVHREVPGCAQLL